ncbi:hypothetical protein L3Y34_005875 [Caenorhabditis briggsae]|uniref:EGF-like domain-containing protein n=2 Tax=Caenorhabditis briggsae TaxID=6238 RepID=A0AAE8ZZN3_CAEBR|nr:hypothetical protein L3Y34_005875 [Caenorhabditis briggsae]
MIVSWPVLFIFLLQYTRNSLGTFLRVETGHQNIAIDGRDTYYGHYTKIHFHNVTCINSIDIHCLKELTGAEEIDLLYSECQKGHWKVAHYTNSKHHFRLKEPIHALRLLISSRKELSVIDAQVTSCTYPPAPPSECHRATRNHNHRHGKTGSILRAVDPYSRIEEEMEAEVEAGAKALARGLNPDPETSRSRRVKRSIEDITMKETNNVRTLSGDQVITEDTVVPHRSQLNIAPGSRLKFQKNVGLVIYGSLNLMGSSSQPVTMEAVNKNERWRGIEFRNASTSSLTHVNISGADVAVSVKGGASPDMDHVVADGNTYGIKISDMDPTTTTHLKSVVSVNNEKTGIEYLGKGSISIDRATAASNGGLGIFINTDQQINIRRSTAYSNNGTGIYVGTSEVTLENVVVNANGFYGIHVEVEKRLEMDGVNVSAHRTEFSVELFTTADAKIGIANSRFHDNKKGGVRISGQFQSPNIIFRDCRFLRNSGEIIQFNDFKNASLIMDKCEFVSSNYIDFDGGDSAVSLKNVTGNGNQLTISNCKFTKNTMHDVIKILETDSSATQIQISANEFNQNLANSIITTNSANASITENRFQDKRSTCEITYYSPAIPKPEDISDNKMLSGNKNPICTGYGYQTVQMDEPVTSTPLPLIGVTGNPFKTSNGVIKAASEPYLINEEVVINIGETVVIEPGTILDFAPGVGITVSGRLIMNGTEEKPIVTRGQNDNTWRGIVAKPEGVLDVKNVVSEDASIGIWIDSQKVKIENGRIVRPVVHGIEITQNSNDVVDLGGLIIEEASESAIGVDERRDDLLIKNTKIQNGVGSGIDFMTPTGNIELQNIIIDNMGAYGIHISEFPSSPLHAVLLENVSVTNQKRGHAGILISGGWIQNVGLHNLNCSNNYVPSLIVALECNDGNEKLIKMDNNSFERNSDIVQHIQLGSCANLQMERNNYNENNADGIGSTLVVTSESNVKKKNGVMEFVKNNFTNNGGIYTVTLDTNVHDAYFTDNFLTDNSNSGAVLKISGENVKIVTNNFDNKNSNYQIAYSDDSPIDATFNEWNGLDEETVLKTIDAKEGAVLIVPYGYTTVSVDNQLDPLTTVIPVTVPDSANIKCAHLAYCSRRGTCRDGICICPHGYTGFDCSIPLFCNCSGNGLCNLLNICMCNEGWSGSDCSTPKCVTNCTGHGKCSAPNKCECNQGWIGETCDITSCQDSNCVHGHCGSNGLCLCESGWQGSRCQIPYCANCSLNGVCIRPGFCSCFEDYGGSDCSKCVGDSCEACDFDCNHGVCEHLTKTCSCSRGWMGGACDVCASGKCDDTSKIQYIQPSTAELEDLNAVVNVFGDGFSITSNNSYVCTFGRTNVTGRRVSSSLIRCPIPSNLTLGRHVFSVSQPESFKVIGNSEAKPIHFTLYDGCEISLCQGSCIGPLCICPQGKTGIFCDVIEVLPSIDKRFLEHQRANTAYEGVPYVLMLPTMASSVLRVNSTIPNLNFIASKGIVAWPEPIGSPYPYEVKVTAFSPAGQTEIAWNITVQPEYAVEVQNVTVDEGVARLRGKLIGPAAASMRKKPVVIRVRRDDTVDEILAESDVNGDVTFDYIPMLPGIYEVTIAHPNVPSDPIHPVRFIIPDMNLHLTGESSNSTLSLNITGPENCEVKVIQPKLENQKIERQGSQTIVDFGRFWDGEVLATVKCEDSPLEIVRAPPIQKNGILTTTPEVLSVYGNENLYEVKVHWPPELEFSPNVVISEGSFDENPVVIPEDKFLRMTFSKVGESIGNGTIQVKDGPNLMSTIPYFYAASNKSQYYTFKICVRDEWDGQEGPLASTEAATIAIQNPQRGIDVTKTNVRLNVQWADFSLQPGTYSLLVRSELHEPVETIIELSPLNTSFCVPLVSSRSRNLPTIHCSHFTDPASCDVTITSVATSDNQLPVFNFQPSVVTTNGQKILVTPRGSLGGTIGLWNGGISGIMVTPSKRSVSINESFWISFSWETNQVTKTCDVKNIQVPFVFLPESSQSQVPMHSSSSVLIRLRVDSNQICDSDNTAVIPATSTLVMCNCGDGARTRCRERYHSATACGGSWAKIADDTVSLEVLASFLAMVFECREVSVDFAELRNSLECVASIESDCPIGARRHKRDVVQMQNDSPFGIIHELNSNTDFGKVLPVLNALDVQTIRISSIFIEFVDRMQKIFPREVIEPLDRDAVDRFLGAIADSSDEGQFISEAERRIIGAEAFSLVQLWNLTVKSWNSGKIPQERVGITHQDAKLLVSAADRIKSISRQNVAQDPFAMLHGYMERMLETGETEQKECATSTVFIDKTEVEEDGQMRIQVFIKNKANITLTNVGVTLSFVKSESKTAAVNFNIGPSWSAGIGSLTGLGSFEAGSSFEIHWTRFISAPRRLTTVAKYQPIIIFSFSSMGRLTQQKLFASEVSVIPKKTIRAINIIKDSLSPKEGTDFSVISAIINHGYTPLKEVEIKMNELKHSGSVTPRLDSVFVNGKLTFKTLTPKFSNIPSGSTQLIRILMKDSDNTIVPISSMNLTCLENQKLLPLETTETYAIRAAGISDFGMLLATPNQSVPLFYFRPSAAQMVNVIKLEFLSIQKVNSSSPSMKSFVAAFRNPESTSFGGALWARMPVPEVHEMYKLVSIVDRGGTRPRELQAVQWMSEENGNQMLNWIDPGSLSPSQQMFYELQFSDPNASVEDENPSFEQLQYRIEIPQNHLEPNTKIGQIEADSSEDLTYFLYAPDNSKRFSVDSETGRIFYDSDEPLSNELEYCVVLEARDPQGRVTRVPVAINNGGQRRDCVLFSTVNLTPILHFGDYIPAPTILTPRTFVFTTTQPTSLMTTFSTTLIDFTPSPITESPSSSTVSETDGTTSNWQTTESWSTSGGSTSSDYHTSESYATTTDSSSWYSSSYATSKGTTSFTESSTWSSTNGVDDTTTKHPSTSGGDDSTSTGTTITFVDSTLETITPTEPSTTSESTTSGEKLTTPLMTTLESEATSPEYITSESTLQSITPPTEMIPTDFPTPSDQMTSTIEPSESTSTVDPLLETSAFPTPDFTLEPITTSTDSSTTDYPDGTTMTSPDVTLPILTTSTEVTWISTIGSSASTSEVTRILPTDPTTPSTPLASTTTESVYTVSSDGTLEPITSEPTTSSSETTTPPEYTISPDSYPETEGTVQPPIRISTVGGGDTYVTSSPAAGTTASFTVSTETPSNSIRDFDCASTSSPLTGFFKMVCDIQLMAKQTHRSQIS